MESILMTTQEVAEYFRVDPSTVRRWRLDGVGPSFIKVGAIYRYPRSAMAEWMADELAERVAS